MKFASYLNTLFIALVVCCSLGSVSVNAQSAQKKDLGAIKIAFLTDKLDITTDEATSFWPVYNEFQAKRKVLRAEQKGTEGVDLDVKQKILDLEKSYLAKFKAVLAPGKVDKLFEAEKEWRQKLITEMQNRKKD